ncbi:MAG: hypothetical protein M0R80_09295 [Proteobacteria bacterium]|jgi:hypothetical protein|nr:hypothetical protein [Pseudomonadota bacterium]
MPKREFEPTWKVHDLEMETADKERAWLNGPNIFVECANPNPERMRAEQKRLTAEGRLRHREFLKYLQVTAGLPIQNADKAVDWLSLAEFEYEDLAWKKLYDTSVDTSERKALFFILAYYLAWKTRRVPSYAEEIERLDETVDALVDSEFWAEDRKAFVAQYMKGVDLDEMLRRQRSAAEAPGANGGNLEAPASHVVDDEPAEPAVSQREKENLSDSKKSKAKDGRLRKEVKAIGAQDAAAGAAQAIAPPVKAERPMFVDGEAVISSPAAARRMGLRPQTLRKWRLEGKGPHYIRQGEGPHARVVYVVSEVDRWKAEHSFRSTAEEAMRSSRKN